MAFFAGDPSAPTRFGEDVASTGDVEGLFLEMFGGMTIAAFKEQTIMVGKHKMVERDSGKSVSFPKTWKVSSEYHTPGQEMLGQTTDETERTISIDGLLVSHVAIADIDAAMSHFDVQADYTRDLGGSIARTFDTNVMRAVVMTANDSATLGGGSSTTSPFPAGQRILSANVTGTLAATGAGSDWWEAVRFMRSSARADNVPDSERLFIALPPLTFDALKYAHGADSLANSPLLMNRDFSFQDKGLGNGVDGAIELEGVVCIPSNLIPQTNDTSNTDIKAKYRFDYSTVLGVGWGVQGVGTYKLIGMGLEHFRDVRRQEDFFVSKMAVGHGSLRNELTWEFANT